MKLRDIDVPRLLVVPRDDVVRRLLIPAMSSATAVSCMAGFFDSASLGQIASGLASFLNESKGVLRLLASPSISLEDQRAIERGLKDPEQVLGDAAVKLFEDGIVSASAIARHAVDCLSYLLAAKRLELKFVLVRRGMFHPKVWLFLDSSDTVVAHGSSNPTTPGLIYNWETIAIEKSWVDAATCREFEELFHGVWEGEDRTSLTVLPLEGLAILKRTTSSQCPTVEDFWRACGEDADKGLVSPLPDVVGRLVEKSADRLSIPKDLRWQDGPFSHQGDAVLGRLVREIEPNPSTGAGPVTSGSPDPYGNPGSTTAFTAYTYDANGNLLTQADASGNTTTYTYDKLNRQTSVEDADLNTTAYTYDAAGNRATLTDADDNTTSWTYDHEGRMTRERTQLDATPTYADNTYIYDANGNLLQEIDGDNRKTTYMYDRLNEQKTETWYAVSTDTTPIRTISYTYDDDGELTDVTDVDGSSANASATYHYDYNGDGTLGQTTTTLAGMTPTVEIAKQYDATGNLTSLEGTLIGTKYDFFNAYQYDALNRLTEAQQLQWPLAGSHNTVASKTVTFTYNDDNQLDTVNRYASDYDDSSALVITSAYGYDGAGRLTSLTDTTAASTTRAHYGWSYQRNDLVASLTDYSHTTEDLTYMGAATTATTSEHFIYDQGQIVLKLGDDGSVQDRYLWAPAVDMLLAQEDGSTNDILWALGDNQNTIRDWVDSSGSVVEHVAYDPFGNVTTTSGSADVDFGWTGKYRDDLTGLQYNINRWYDPQLGKWMSQDPMSFSAGDANLYRYVYNSPTNGFDINGLEPITVFKVHVDPNSPFRLTSSETSVDIHGDCSATVTTVAVLESGYKVTGVGTANGFAGKLVFQDSDGNWFRTPINAQAQTSVLTKQRIILTGKASISIDSDTEGVNWSSASGAINSVLGLVAIAFPAGWLGYGITAAGLASDAGSYLLPDGQGTVHVRKTVSGVLQHYSILGDSNVVFSVNTNNVYSDQKPIGSTVSSHPELPTIAGAPDNFAVFWNASSAYLANLIWQSRNAAKELAGNTLGKWVTDSQWSED